MSENQYGEPWRVTRLDHAVWLESASDLWMLHIRLGQDSVEIAERFASCINACAGMSDDELREMEIVKVMVEPKGEYNEQE